MAGSVGIVLVSHSPELASGVRALLDQLGAPPRSIATAAGTDDGRLGTSHQLLAAAIKVVDQGAGVVLLPDLGSSVLTARALLSEDSRDDVVLVDAPFVEGAVAAAVAVATGAELAAVVSAAQEARHAAKF